MKKELEILKTLVALTENDVLDEHTTFFEIIKRSHDEDLISRMLAYVLKKDDELCIRLLYKYFNETKNFSVGKLADKKVICEKNMGGKRVDIFVVIVDEFGRSYTIVIENKIYSWEHDNQTQAYSEWMRRGEYRSNHNAFFYLKPTFNASLPSADDFSVITYNELYDLIGSTDDTFVKDFKLFIRNRLKNKEVKFMDSEAEKLLLNNYRTIKNLVDEEENKIASFKNDFIVGLLDDKKADLPNVIKGVYSYPWGKNKDVCEGELYVEKADKDCVFRFYRYGNGGWYYWDENNKQNSYYFYCEIKFDPENDSENPMSKICFQMTIKKYDIRNKCKVDRFIEDCAVKYFDYVSDQYYIIERKDFSCDYPILSKKWIAELKAKTAETLNTYITQTDEMFARFKKYSDEQAE